MFRNKLLQFPKKLLSTKEIVKIPNNDINDYKNTINRILNSSFRSSLFSSFALSNSNFPISSVINYYLDFDGKPFFIADKNNSLMMNQISNLKETSKSSINIYDFENDKLLTKYSNLILYGFVNLKYDIDQIERFNWIINDNNDLISKSQDNLYFKMDEIEQIELITNNLNQLKMTTSSINYNSFEFLRHSSFEQKLNINSRKVKRYLHENFNNEIKSLVIKDLDITDPILVDIDEIVNNKLILNVYYFNKSNDSKKIEIILPDSVINIDSLLSFLNYKYFKM